MFEVETDDPTQLKRIAAAGTGALTIGFLIVGFNLVRPLLVPAGYELPNLLFGLLGVAVIIWAAHPTYEAASKLDEST